MLRAASLVFVFAVSVPLAANDVSPPDAVHRQCYTCEDEACEQPPIERVSCSATEIYCYTLVRRDEVSDEHVRVVYDDDDTYVGDVKRRGCTSACVHSKWEGYTCVQCSGDSCNDASHRTNFARPAAPRNSSQERTTWEEMHAVWSIVTSDARMAAVALFCSFIALVVLAASCCCACHLARYAYHIVVKHGRRLRTKKQRNHVRAADAEAGRAERTPLARGLRDANTVDVSETAALNVSLAGSLDNVAYSVSPDVVASPKTHTENTVSTVALCEKPSSHDLIDAERAPLKRTESFRAVSAPATPLVNQKNTSVSDDVEACEEISGSCASIDSQGLGMRAVNRVESVEEPSAALSASSAPSPTALLASLEETVL